MNIWPAVSYLIEKIPLERIFVHHEDSKKELEELSKIFKEFPQATAPIPAVTLPEVKPNKNTTSSVSTEETINYQNREMGKVLIQMERHLAQGMIIAGKPCDCIGKHLVDLEALAEETITMVSNPEVYLEIMEWLKDIAPKTTVEANESGVFKQEYPGMSRKARDFRKQLLGTLDYKALFWDKQLEEIQRQKSGEELIEDARWAQTIDTQRELYEKLEAMDSETRQKWAIDNNWGDTEDAAYRSLFSTMLKNPLKKGETWHSRATSYINKYHPVSNTVENMPENITVSGNAETEKEPEITENGTICKDLKSMTEWVAGEDAETCRTCMLTVTIPWYFDELEERGYKDLSNELEEIQTKGDPTETANLLDTIKEKVDAEARKRLLEFDCATQSFENDVSGEPSESQS